MNLFLCEYLQNKLPLNNFNEIYKTVMLKGNINIIIIIIIIIIHEAQTQKIRGSSKKWIKLIKKKKHAAWHKTAGMIRYISPLHVSSILLCLSVCLSVPFCSSPGHVPSVSMTLHKTCTLPSTHFEAIHSTVYGPLHALILLNNSVGGCWHKITLLTRALVEILAGGLSQCHFATTNATRNVLGSSLDICGESPEQWHGPHGLVQF